MPELNVSADDGELDKDSDEYKQKMMDKAKGKDIDISDPEGVETEEDTLLAGKYESEDDLNQGVIEALKQQYDTEDVEEIYKNLEKDMHSQNQEEDDEGSDEDEEVNEESDNEEEDEEVKEDTQEDLEEDLDNYDKYYNELVETGELSEESIEELEEQGYSRHIIDNYIKGVQAEVQQMQQEIYDIVGGEDEYEEMLGWAEDVLSEDEAEAFNEALSSDNRSQAKFAVEALYSRYTNSGNRKPNLVKGKKPSSSVDTYSSRQELMEDMSDPRYQKDPAFRQRVKEKLHRSNIF